MARRDSNFFLVVVVGGHRFPSHFSGEGGGKQKTQLLAAFCLHYKEIG